MLHSFFFFFFFFAETFMTLQDIRFLNTTIQTYQQTLGTAQPGKFCPWYGTVFGIIITSSPSTSSISLLLFPSHRRRRRRRPKKKNPSKILESMACLKSFPA
ncbi:hypothetical protein QBC42DRAFT_35555 [Cladorrhinum samala]|uniref:Secreted protein n=1 Tax=Cladorrhinum samala TaxID=585594 RepID=A0AAV9HAZ4_9PEZI|nr:hypothetical protein QBC42DRAFT_35555 [Cladorrhinum samala]